MSAPRRFLPIPPAGAFCDHVGMADHCPGESGDGCGHLVCTCGIFWDEAAEGGGPLDDPDELLAEMLAELPQ